MIRLKEKLTWEHRPLLEHFYRIGKDQIASLASFESFVHRLLPIYQQAAIDGKIPIWDTGRLYQTVSRTITPILNGESLKHLSLLLVSRLSTVERILLIAAYVCSHNPAKFDLRLFGSLVRRSRVYNASGVGKGKMTATAVKSLRAAPRSFLLDRLMAVFFFIFPADGGVVPATMVVYRQLGVLVEMGLIARVTHRNRLDMVKFRCPLPVDFMGMVGKAASFDLFRYLVSSY